MNQVMTLFLVLVIALAKSAAHVRHRIWAKSDQNSALRASFAEQPREKPLFGVDKARINPPVPENVGAAGAAEQAASSSKSNSNAPIDQDLLNKLLQPWKEAWWKWEPSKTFGYLDSHFPRYIATMRILEPYMKSNMHILDVGGQNDFWEVLMKHFGENIRVENVNGDFREDFKVKRDAYDMIWSLEVVEHLSDRASLYARHRFGSDIETSRTTSIKTSSSVPAGHHYTGIYSYYLNCVSLLKPGGYMLTTTPAADSWFGAARLMGHFRMMHFGIHFKEYSIDELTDIQQAVGLGVVSVQTVNFWDYAYPYTMKVLDEASGGIPGPVAQLLDRSSKEGKICLEDDAADGPSAKDPQQQKSSSISPALAGATCSKGDVEAAQNSPGNRLQTARRLQDQVIISQRPLAGGVPQTTVGHGLSKWRVSCVFGSDDDGTEHKKPLSDVLPLPKRSSANDNGAAGGAETSSTELPCKRYTIDVSEPAFVSGGSAGVAPAAEAAQMLAAAQMQAAAQAAEPSETPSGVAAGGPLARHAFDAMFERYKVAFPSDVPLPDDLFISTSAGSTSASRGDPYARRANRYFKVLQLVEPMILGADAGVGNRATVRILDASGLGPMVRGLIHGLFPTNQDNIAVDFLSEKQDLREDFATENIDVEKPSDSTEKYDVILGLDVLESLTDRAAMYTFGNHSTPTHHFTGLFSYLVNCFSLLKEGGRLVTVTPNQASWDAIGRVLLRNSKRTSKGFQSNSRIASSTVKQEEMTISTIQSSPLSHHEYTTRELEFLMGPKNAGFKIETVTEANLLPVEQMSPVLRVATENLGGDLGGLRGGDLVLVAQRPFGAAPANELHFDESGGMYSKWRRICIQRGKPANTADSPDESCQRYSVDTINPIIGYFGR